MWQTERTPNHAYNHLQTDFSWLQKAQLILPAVEDFFWTSELQMFLHLSIRKHNCICLHYHFPFITMHLRSRSHFDPLIYQPQKTFFLHSCHVCCCFSFPALSSAALFQFVCMHIAALGGWPLTPAVHLMEEQQEQSGDDESYTCHEETRPIITHLVNEES